METNLWRVEDNGRETRRHLRVETDLDTCLDLVLGLDERVQKFVCVNDSLTVVRHQTNEGCVPLIDDLRERRRARTHEHLTDTVVELLHTLVRYTKESLSRALLGLFIREVPNSIFERVLFATHRPDLGQDANLETAHGEEELWVVPRINADECVLPLDRCQRPRQAVLDVPEHGAAKVHIVLNEPHTTVARPATLVVVPNDVIIRRIGVSAEIPLDEVAGLLSSEPEEDVELVDVTRVETNRMAGLRGRIAILQEVVRHLRWTGHLARTLKTEDEDIQNETIVLEDEGGELETTDKTISVCVCHVCNVREPKGNTNNI
jgi:hypothetical protein